MVTATPTVPVLVDDYLITQKEVTRLTSLTRTTIYNEERAGRFPKRIQLTPKRIAWSLSAVQAWIADRKTNRLAAYPPNVLRSRRAR